jgi:hypothetical protein
VTRSTNWAIRADLMMMIWLIYLWCSVIEAQEHRETLWKNRNETWSDKMKSNFLWLDEPTPTQARAHAIFIAPCFDPRQSAFGYLPAALGAWALGVFRISSKRTSAQCRFGDIRTDVDMSKAINWVGWIKSVMIADWSCAYSWSIEVVFCDRVGDLHIPLMLVDGLKPNHDLQFYISRLDDELMRFILNQTTDGCTISLSKPLDIFYHTHRESWLEEKQIGTPIVRIPQH